MNIVTGFRNEPHVTAEDMRVLIRSVYGNGSAITAIGEKLEPELISNNEVRIHDGAIVQQGCFGRIEANTYEVITIDNGSQDMKRIDLIVSRYEMNADTGIESMTLKLIKGEESEGTPIEPSYVSGNIEDGDLVDEFPLFRINLDGITVTSVDRLAEPVQQVYSFDSIAESEISPALRNHSVGEYISYNGKLYKVTTAITAGGTVDDKILEVKVMNDTVKELVETERAYTFRTSRALGVNGGSSLTNLGGTVLTPNVPSGFKLVGNVNLTVNGQIGILASFDGGGQYVSTSVNPYITNLTNSTLASGSSMTIRLYSICQRI